MQIDTQNRLLSKREVAKLLGCDIRTIDRLRQRLHANGAPILPAIRLSNSLIRFSPADVMAAIQSLKEPVSSTDRSAA